MKKIDTIAAYVCAAIFLQTLFFKFTAAQESVWIFETLGVEPWGRYFSGVMELISAIALIRLSTRVYGALLGAGIMGGAAISHIAILGIEVQNDGGLLFILAMVCLIATSLIILHRRKELPLRFLSSVLVCLIPFVAEAKVSYNTEPKYGIHGYDPVSYITLQKAQEGKKDINVSFDGVTYLFETLANKEVFLKEPQKYIPAYGGWCAYAMADGEKVDIDPKKFKIINGKAYLFYNGIWGDTLKKWEKDEINLKAKADESWQKLIK